MIFPSLVGFRVTSNCASLFFTILNSFLKSKPNLLARHSVFSMVEPRANSAHLGPEFDFWLHWLLAV